MKSRHIDLGRVSKVTAALAAVAAASSAFTSTGDASSVALGGTFALGNFYLIRMLVSLLIRGEQEPLARASTLALLTLKMLLVVLLVAAVVYQFPVEPLSFALGASTLLVALVLEAVVLGQPVIDSIELEMSKS